MKYKIENKTFPEERALYHLQDAEVINCRFEGEEDGESCFKEARHIKIRDSYFNLRYPLWHTHHFELINSELDDMARAAFWYSTDGIIKNVKINTIKSFRNSEDIHIMDSKIVASEVGWFCNRMTIDRSYIEGDYPFLRAENIKISHSTIEGKYSLQYMKNVEITDSILNTKDLFWHSENVVVKNSKVNGAYLGWYGKNIVLENCEITGTQPLCYTEGVKLIDCKMTEADLAFEYSDVEADIIGHIDSVKNPKSGYIKADSIGKIILEKSIYENKTNIIIKGE